MAAGYCQRHHKILASYHHHNLITLLSSEPLAININFLSTIISIIKFPFIVPREPTALEEMVMFITIMTIDAGGYAHRGDLDDADDGHYEEG